MATQETGSGSFIQATGFCVREQVRLSKALLTHIWPTTAAYHRCDWVPNTTLSLRKGPPGNSVPSHGSINPRRIKTHSRGGKALSAYTHTERTILHLLHNMRHFASRPIQAVGNTGQIGTTGHVDGDWAAAIATRGSVRRVDRDV